jgi:hypothetical protein
MNVGINRAQAPSAAVSRSDAEMSERIATSRRARRGKINSPRPTPPAEVFSKARSLDQKVRLDFLRLIGFFFRRG